MDSLAKIIANNIFSLRSEYNLTQQEFAEKLDIDITREQISRIETGLSVPNARFIWAVSNAFKISADWLLSTQNTNIPSFDITNSELKLLYEFRKLPEDTQQTISTLINIMYGTNKKL